jgi:L-aspartate oxidase
VASLRSAMSREAGVVRDAAGLRRLLGVIEALEAEHGQAPALVAARLTARCALARNESRGGHFRADAPEKHPAAERTFVRLAELDAAAALRFAAE